MKDYAFIIAAFALVIGLAWYCEKGKANSNHMPFNNNTDFTADVSSPLKFKVSGSFEYYPDLSFLVFFKNTPTDTFLKILNAYSFAYAKKYEAYTDTAILDTIQTGYLLYYDFQATPYSKPMLQEFFTGINNLPGSDNIDVIKVNE